MDPVVHFELPYDDRPRIMRFYEAVFGWRLEVAMGDYVLATTTSDNAGRPGSRAGGIDGGFFQRKADWPGQHPSVVVAVGDIVASMQKVRSGGGEVLGEPMEIPGVGQYVAFLDTEGNRLSMLQPVPRAAG